VTAWLAFSLAGFTGLLARPPEASGEHVAASLPADLFGAFASLGALPLRFLALTLLGAFALGFFSVLANGCPFRQHVLAAQGVAGAAYYLVGFYGGLLLYAAYLAHVLARWL
jgi:uncharacterized membrane protein YedE/YeeE